MPGPAEIEGCEAYHQELGYGPNAYCQVCHGSGWLHPARADGKPNYGRVILCTEPGCADDSYRRRQGSQAFLQAQGVSDLKGFAGFRRRAGAEDALDSFQSLARGAPGFRMLLCNGGTGCGKTHLCEALTIELNKRMVDTRLYAAPDLFANLKGGFPTGRIDGLIMGLKTVQGLVIDDFVCSDWELGRMEEVIDARRRKEGAITVLTSNQDIAWFQEHSPRLYSRFSEEGIGRIVLNSASDARVMGV